MNPPRAAAKVASWPPSRARTPHFPPLSRSLTNFGLLSGPPRADIERRRVITRAIFAYITTVAVALIILLATGCAGPRGTRQVHAEALDVHTSRGGAAITGARVATAPSAAATAPERIRWRLTTTQADPPTARQRAAAIIGTAGGAALVALIALAIFAPGALAAWALRRYLAVRRALSQTVRGIQSARIVARDPETHNALSASQDAKTKALVNELKHAE